MAAGPGSCGWTGPRMRDRADVVVVPGTPIRLLALDIDGTLVAGPADSVLSERIVAAVRAAMDRGVIVLLVTGRMGASARPVAAALGVTGPLIAHHGAVIGEPGRLLVHTPLAAAVARDVVDWAADRGLPAHLNHLDRLVMRTDDPRADAYGRLLGVRPVLVPDLRDALSRPVTKVMVGGEPLDPQVLAEARSAFAGRATVTSSSTRFVEMLDPHVSKGRALARLARRLGVPLAQAMAIGDTWSDLDMLEAVGHPVAMPDAPAAVLAAANHVAPPLHEEGAAVMIETLILGRAPSRARRSPAAAAAT